MNAQTVTDTQAMSQMELTCMRNLLKDHTGLVMFCPRCGRCLDCKRSVSIEVFKHDVSVRTYIMCASCWDKEQPTIAQLVTESNGVFRIEVLDGRILFGKAKRTASSMVPR